MATTNPLGGRVVRSASPQRGDRLDESQLELSSPRPSLRTDITEVHYSRWLIEQTNLETGNHRRQEMDSQRAFRTEQRDRFLHSQQQVVEKTHAQMAAAAAKVDKVREKNLEVGREMRLNLGKLRSVYHEKRNVWTSNGRRLVEHAKTVQADNLRERLDSHRGKRRAQGRKTRDELKALTARREAELEEARQRKKDAHEQVRKATADEVTEAAKQLMLREKGGSASMVRSSSEVRAGT